jgi:hypothetical protein
LSVFLPYSHALFNICGRYTLAQFDDEFGDLLDVDDIFALLGVLLVLYYLGASGDLEWLFFLHSLPVGGNIPEMWWSESSVRFLYACWIVS